MDRFTTLRGSLLLREFSEVGVRILAEACEERSVGRGTYASRSMMVFNMIAAAFATYAQDLGRLAGHLWTNAVASEEDDDFPATRRQALPPRASAAAAHAGVA